MLKAIGSRKDLKQQLYYEFVADLLESKSVQDLKQYAIISKPHGFNIV